MSEPSSHPYASGAGPFNGNLYPDFERADAAEVVNQQAAHSNQPGLLSRAAKSNLLAVALVALVVGGVLAASVGGGSFLVQHVDMPHKISFLNHLAVFGTKGAAIWSGVGGTIAVASAVLLVAQFIKRWRDRKAEENESAPELRVESDHEGDAGVRSGGSEGEDTSASEGEDFIYEDSAGAPSDDEIKPDLSQEQAKPENEASSSWWGWLSFGGGDVPEHHEPEKPSEVVAKRDAASLIADPQKDAVSFKGKEKDKPEQSKASNSAAKHRLRKMTEKKRARDLEAAKQAEAFPPGSPPPLPERNLQYQQAAKRLDRDRQRKTYEDFMGRSTRDDASVGQTETYHIRSNGTGPNDYFYLPGATSISAPSSQQQPVENTPKQEEEIRALHKRVAEERRAVYAENDEDIINRVSAGAAGVSSLEGSAAAARKALRWVGLGRFADSWAERNEKAKEESSLQDS